MQILRPMKLQRVGMGPSGLCARVLQEILMPLVLSHTGLQYFPWMGLTGRIEFSPILAKMKNLGSKKEKGVIQILDAKDLERKGWNGKNTEPKEGGKDTMTQQCHWYSQVSKGQISETKGANISSWVSVPSVLPTELSKWSF